MRASRNFSWFPAVIPAVMAGILAVGCADLSDEARLAEAEVRDVMPTQEFDNVEMVQTKEGDLQFILYAPRLERYDKLDQAILYGGIRIEFFENDEITSTLTAERGEVHGGGRELLALGNVIVVSDTGTTILTPRLHWSRATGEISTDTVVTIITEFDTLYGTGMIASEDLKRRRILQPTGVSYRTLTETEDGTSDAAADLEESPSIMDSILYSPDSVSVQFDSTMTTTSAVSAGDTLSEEDPLPVSEQ